MRILFFAQLRDVTCCSEMQWDCCETDAAGLWRMLLAAHPGLARLQSSVRLARNSEYVAGDTRFTNDDEVALIPPVSGG